MPDDAPPLAWVLICSALTMLTLPGVALFYGGMVRRKNVLNTIGLAFLALVLASCLGVIGRGMTGALDPASSPGSSPWSAAFIGTAVQVMAAALSLALVAGAVVERLRISFFLLFGLLWLLLVYGVVFHWLWDGWLAALGVLDFAGGAMVHLTAGVAALVVALLVGPRRGFGRSEMKPNNLPASACGAALFWVGCCGFAGGLGRASMSASAGAFVAIHLAAAAAALAWTGLEWLQRDKPTVLGTISGAVAGLVAIMPGAGYIAPLWAVVVGIGAGGLCYMVVNYVKPILGYDDSLDAFGMHAVGGAWGMLAAGFFASLAVNPNGSDGLFYGYPYQFFVQIVAVLVVAVFAAAMTVLLVTVARWIVAPRVDDEAEVLGLDLSQHGERGYS